MATPLDPTSIVLDDVPSEWGTVPSEILERLLPVTARIVYGPNGEQKLYDMRGMITPEQKCLIDRIAAGRWFLLRNDGPTGRLKCGRCGQRHTYFTLACVERPFHGLQEIVGLMRQVKGRDLEFSAVRLGTIEPITRSRAQRLLGQIRQRGEIV